MISYGQSNNPTIIQGLGAIAEAEINAAYPIIQTPSLSTEIEVLVIATVIALLSPEPFGLYLLIAILSYVVLLHRKDILGILGVAS